MTITDDFQLLKKHGFKLLPYEIAKNDSEAKKIAKKIGYPVAMKVVSSEIEHKSDIGGVKIKIRNEAALLVAYADIMHSVSGKKIDGIMIQKMARPGVELIVGGKKDAQFGHMIVLGLGGIYVEIFRDISARLCPVNRTDIEEMIAELKSHPLLEGARGAKPINKKALEDVILGMCKFMHEENIMEMDLNPIIVDENGYDIVDARFSK